MDKGVCYKGFFGILVIVNVNPIAEYLDYSNCKCRKKLVDKLVEKCTKSIDKVEIASKNEHKKCSSCTLYIVLFSIIFTISIGMVTYFVYSHWYLKNDDACVMLDTRTETTIY